MYGDLSDESADESGYGGNVISYSRCKPKTMQIVIAVQAVLLTGLVCMSDESGKSQRLISQMEEKFLKESDKLFL
tara:strand:+ start:619 stop:843 length:225 start_codon:yes stop_codon:yes gene_type:complete